MNMKLLDDEIKMTLNLMQTGIHDTTHDVLQDHLYYLLEIKRNNLQQLLTEPDTYEHPPYKNVKLDGQVADEAKPLTADDLRAGGWWCADTSEDTLNAFKLLGFKDGEYTPWDGSFYGCFLYEIGYNLIDRGFRHHTAGLKEIHQIGSEFYWVEECHSINSIRLTCSCSCKNRV